MQAFSWLSVPEEQQARQHSLQALHCWRAIGRHARHPRPCRSALRAVGYMLTVQPISGWDNWNTPEHLETLRRGLLRTLLGAGQLSPRS